MVVGAGVGLIHTLNCDPKAVADLVPGDYVVNSVIAAAWKMARDHPGNHEEAPMDQLPVIYNYVSSEQKPLTWGKTHWRRFHDIGDNWHRITFGDIPTFRTLTRVL